MTLNKSYSKISSDLKQASINPARMHFVDCTSEECSAKNCTAIGTPGSLTEMSLAITTAVNTGEYKFMVIDSVNTLLAYNEQKMVKQFLHYLVHKLDKLGVGGAIIVITGGDADDIIPVISQFFDKTISMVGHHHKKGRKV